VNESYTATDALADRCCWLGVFSTNTADADTPSLSLHDVDGLRVRNSRHSTSSKMLRVQKICS